MVNTIRVSVAAAVAAACLAAVTPARAQDVVNALDFGLMPCQVEGCDPVSEPSQTEALHAAMRYFFDQGVPGTVYIPAGTYAIGEALRFHAGVNLVGDGMEETVLKKVGAIGAYVVGNPVLRPGSTALNATVSDLTFDADRTRRAALGGLPLVGCLNIDADVSALTLLRVGARDSTNAMILRRLKDSRIAHSHIDGKAGHGIATGQEGLPVGEFRNVVIEDNLITNSTAGAGINLSRAAYTVVRRNRVVNEAQQSDTYGGIRIPNGGEFNVVSANLVRGYPRGLFVLSGAHDNLFRDNLVVDSRIHGMLIQAEANTVVNNVFRQDDPGLNPEAVIRLATDSSQNASGNHVLHNRIETHDAYSRIGIRLTGLSNDNRIVNNEIETLGLLVSDESTGTGNVVEANHAP